MSSNEDSHWRSNMENQRSSLTPMSYNDQYMNPEDEILTKDDHDDLKQGLELKKYDVFILYVDADKSCGENIRNRMEDEYKLKVCDRNRDLLGIYGSNNHFTVTKFVTNRCDKILVIVSENSASSDFHNFIYQYFCFVNCEKNTSVMIPCISEQHNLPLFYRCYYSLNYEQHSKYDFFWKRLHSAILGQVENLNVDVEPSKVADVVNSKTKQTRAKVWFPNLLKKIAKKFQTSAPKKLNNFS